METKEIGGKKFVAALSLRQDELLAPIILEMVKECPHALSHAGESTLDILSKLRDGQSQVKALKSGDTSAIDLDAIKKNIEETQKASVSIAMDMITVQAWIYSKGYAKRIMAIILVLDGEKFDETKIYEREEFFGEHADRNTANEVISFFLTRSGVFGIGTRASSPMETATK
ncbi:MAG: hypothetical protein HYV29_08065 [Ignavibacteriales bacterium]|nr:hypothetical protein [Ignavibacteriales bacterium]